MTCTVCLDELQVRSVTVLEQRMRMLAYDGELGRGRADAFLCVSGSHPARQLPFAGRSVHVI